MLYVWCSVMNALNLFLPLRIHSDSLIDWCVVFYSHSIRSWDSWASSRTQVLRVFSTTCSSRTVHGTPKSSVNFARTCTASGWRPGRTMTCYLASRSTCRSVVQCFAVVAVSCLWLSPTSAAPSSRSSSMTPWIVSVVSASSTVCLFTTSLTPAHDLTSSTTCAASTTTQTIFGRNLNLLSEVSYILQVHRENFENHYLPSVVEIIII